MIVAVDDLGLEPDLLEQPQAAFWKKMKRAALSGYPRPSFGSL